MASRTERVPHFSRPLREVGTTNLRSCEATGIDHPPTSNKTKDVSWGWRQLCPTGGKKAGPGPGLHDATIHLEVKKATYNWQENAILAPCPDCGAITSFDTRGHSNTSLGAVIINYGYHTYENRQFSRILWQFFRCNVCSRGGVAKLHDGGGSQTALLESFHPVAVEHLSLPPRVPDDVSKEFREAELVASLGAYRAASALLRSVLEKVLAKNGYVEVDAVGENGKGFKSKSLKHRINAAADDGVITESRRKRAQENIRVLGNDILHDEWRVVEESEYEDAHLYSQRILEDLYDDRDTVESVLNTKQRNFTAAPAQPSPAPVMKLFDGR